ncbi:hypothetical protein [Evansella halocellulosilytica]|uniref:hypothetical protein n=1 Tax=Evansella halocellulosilytica TaxID=2011013 RepID=UPI000BB84E12|nr:hypothetical protein [Evansella halocellulosilytica]
MDAWWSLVKKEFRLGQPALILAIASYIVFSIIAIYFANRAGFGIEALLIVSGIAVILHVFYLVYYLLYSLEFERKRLHLWLHNPMPGYGLLLAKFVAGIFSMLITITIPIAVALTVVFISDAVAVPVSWAHIIEGGIYGFISLFFMAISIAIWFLFYWMIFLCLTRWVGTFLSFLGTFIFVIVTLNVYNWFTSLNIYDLLTQWGGINLGNMLTGLSYSMDLESGAVSEVVTDMATIYVGAILYEAVLLVIIFAAATWLLNRKVEV